MCPSVRGLGTPREVAALVAFYEDRFEDALKQLDTIGTGLPWFYEAPALRGDILVARAQGLVQITKPLGRDRALFLQTFGGVAGARPDLGSVMKRLLALKDFVGSNEKAKDQ